MSSKEEIFCEADEKNPYVYFGTKSSYELIRQNKTYRSVPGCEPIKLWLLSRHGTRYPSVDKMERMKNGVNLRDRIVQNYEENRGSLCEKDIENFKTWAFNLKPDLSNELTDQGRTELRLHAARLRNAFPTLFNVSFVEKQFQFQSTSEKRAIDSANVFAEELINYDIFSATDVSSSMHNDELLHTERFCQRWLQMKDDPETFVEATLFKNTSHVKQMISRISERLGFVKNLTIDEIYIMYDVCRYETAWNLQSRSPFCTVFTKDDLEIMEFLEDLKYYYKNGYGNKINLQLGCLLAKDLIQTSLKTLKTSDKNGLTEADPPVRLYFSHMGPLLQFLTALGLKKDSQRLTHDKFEKMKDREWRTSKMVPFTSNFVAVFYKCKDDDAAQDKVMFYLNEDVVNFPDCSVGLCPLDYILDKYKSFVNSNVCDLNLCRH